MGNKRASIQRIVKALSSPKSVQQLLHLTQLPERTLRYNLAFLKRLGVIKETYLFSDRRRKLFWLTAEIGGE